MDSIAAARAGAQFEGMLLEQMLSPLGESLRQYGNAMVAPLAQSIAEHDAHGFGATVAAMLEDRA